MLSSGTDIFFYTLVSYVVGGPSASRSMDRRSYGMESVEDDPFILAAAASTQSLNSISNGDMRKNPNINYGYSSEGMEMCCVPLNPSQVPFHRLCQMLTRIVSD